MPALSSRPLIAVLAATLALCATPVLAQPGWGGWGGSGFGGPSRWDRASAPRDDREGRVDCERFLADGAAPALAKGMIAVRTLAGSAAEGREQATFEAAIIDQLAKAGYDTATPDPMGGQIVELTITRDELEPAEDKKNPISGSGTVGVSNRGSYMGLSLSYDATKPRGALISTGLEIRIRDRASGAALYEGRARIAAREGDTHYTDTAIATRLAAALFDHFPSSSPAR
jgi:hypothetical protein